MLWVVFLAQWMMPLFFLLSAMSSVFVLRRRSVGRYLIDRVKRLLVPFLFGTFVVLIPLQVWIERVTTADFDGGFWAFYPRYFDGWYAFGGNFAWMGLHLWYLEFLFLFSVVTAPAFAGILRRPTVTSRLASLCRRPGGMLLLVLPIFLCELFVNQYPDGIGIRDFGGWSLLTYLVFFVLGFVMATDDGFRIGCERFRVAALAIGAVIVFTEVAWSSVAAIDSAVVLSGLRALNAWSWLIAILGFASHHLTRPTAFLSYGNEAVLPFYALHQTVIVFLGFLMLEWSLAVPLKFAILVMASFVAIASLYHCGIRPWWPVRLLFGMKR
jgi:hypothetical protein